MGHAASRRHRRVARKSRYDDWIVDAFPGLIRGWPLDDPADASAFREVTGSGDAASISGTYGLQQGSLVGGVQGAARTDGSTATSDAGDVSALDFGSSDSFSVSMWIGALPATDGTNSFPVEKQESSVGYWRLTIVDFSSKYAARIRVFDGSDSVNATSSFRSRAAMNTGPRHVTGVVDRSSDEARIYIDGVEEGAADISNVGDLSNAGGVKIAQGTAQQYTAQHVYVFGSALAPSDITALYKQGAEFFDRGRLL